MARGGPLPPHYPATSEALIPPLQRPLPSTIINIPSLLARLQLTHHRLGPLQRSPPFLVPFFWPWACCATFPITYLEYLCATNAMEHVRLAFVRWKDASSSDSSGLLGGPASAASLGVPTRLKDRIRSHPPYSLRTSRLVTLSHRRLLSLGSCFDIGPMALGTTRSGPTSTSVTPFVDVAAAAAVGAHPFLVFSSSSSATADEPPEDAVAAEEDEAGRQCTTLCQQPSKCAFDVWVGHASPWSFFVLIL